LPAGAGATSMGEGVSNCSEPAPDVASGCIFEACMSGETTGTTTFFREPGVRVLRVEAT
jgi:hypothetical protein